MNLRNLLVGLIGLSVFVPLARAGDVYVIAHPALKFSPEMLRDAYIGDKQFASDVKLVLSDNAVAQTDFLSRVVKMEPTKYDNLWTRKSFRDALNPPALKSTDREVIEFVKRTPGAVGYSSAAPPAGVNLVQKY